MSNCLVTGGAGFIGSHLAERLIKDGHNVLLLDNLSTGKIENTFTFHGEKNFKGLLCFPGDIANINFCTQACKNIDIVFHQAALGSVPRSVDDPIASNNANVNGTLNMLWAAKERGVKKFIFASSSSVYGDNPALPKNEKMECLPVSPYAGSKLACEHYCRIFYKAYGLETVSLRYFNVFGPRQNEKGAYACAIPAFIKNALEGKKPIVFGNGEQTRDFCHVENVVEANILAANYNVPGQSLQGDVFNIACGERISLNQILIQIEDLIGKRIIAVYKDERPGDVKDTLADISKAKFILGYEPSIFFNEGLKKTLEWYKENLEKK